MSHPDLDQFTVDGALARMCGWGWTFVAYRDRVVPEPLVAHFRLNDQVDVLVVDGEDRCGAYRARVRLDQDPVDVHAVTWSVTGDIRFVLRSLLRLPPVDRSRPDLPVPPELRALLPCPSIRHLTIRPPQ